MPKNKGKWDFSGYAASYNALCTDGTTLLDGFAKEQDGKIVPLVFQHNHKTNDNVLGTALLEYRPNKGVYCYGSFNNTPMGALAKEQVAHGDISSLSIFANQLTQDARRNISHGKIIEVSLVLAGADPGAFIDKVAIAHSDTGAEYVEEMIYYSPRHITSYLAHADNSPESKLTIKEVFDTMSREQKACCVEMMRQGIELDRASRAAVAHADGDGDDGAEYEDDEEYEEDESEPEEEEDEESEDDEEEDEEDSDLSDALAEIDNMEANFDMIHDPQVQAELAEIINDFGPEEDACVETFAKAVFGDINSVTPKQAAKALKTYDNMSPEQKFAVYVALSAMNS